MFLLIFSFWKAESGFCSDGRVDKKIWKQLARGIQLDSLLCQIVSHSSESLRWGKAAVCTACIAKILHLTSNLTAVFCVCACTYTCMHACMHTYTLSNSPYFKFHTQWKPSCRSGIQTSQPGLLKPHCAPHRRRKYSSRKDIWFQEKLLVYSKRPLRHLCVCLALQILPLQKSRPWEHPHCGVD